MKVRPQEGLLEASSIRCVQERFSVHMLCLVLQNYFSGSAGVEVVSALRPLWGDSSLWRIDPEPVMDLTRSGSGPNHEFGDVGGMVRLADGSLVVADATYRQIRLYSPEGGFLASNGRAGEGPGEFSGGITEMVGATDDTAWVLDRVGRVSVFGPDLALASHSGPGMNSGRFAIRAYFGASTARVPVSTASPRPRDTRNTSYRRRAATLRV